MQPGTPFAIVTAGPHGMQWVGLPDRAAVDQWLAANPGTPSLVVQSTAPLGIEDHS